MGIHGLFLIQFGCADNMLGWRENTNIDQSDRKLAGAETFAEALRRPTYVNSWPTYRGKCKMIHSH